MKAILALLFLAAVAVYARAEMEYHPQAILHYLEMEDEEMARKVRGLVGPSARPSFPDQVFAQAVFPLEFHQESKRA
ncbi:hypothetical protein ACROYT_G001140 [Oculina patagonica]